MPAAFRKSYQCAAAPLPPLVRSVLQSVLLLLLLSIQNPSPSCVSEP